ncbi:Protein-disulfide isomerase [Nonomuraea pusilla]|uniref:Protein-disulfide isomerase n=1 Tax=Nonomuraea pusilla TaxID=46177 RepID=A0A1H7KL31_9ACTN|nr:Protein-disulfide isomerase [Nonomuraea pusilla]
MRRVRNERRRVLAGSLAGAAVLGVLGFAALRPDGSGGAPEQLERPVAASGATPEGAPTSGPPASGTPSPQPSGTPVWEGPTPPPVDMKLSKGSDRAPVTIVEFGDFDCPNCRRYARSIAPELERRYLDTGVVRVFWRDYPIRGRRSVEAAVAARAASRQGRFWQFHDALYSGTARLTEDGLRAAARQAGLDLARFDADRRDKAVREAVQQEGAFAADLGLPGTPAFLINGKLLFGAQPLEVFVRAIEQARRGS